MAGFPIRARVIKRGIHYLKLTLFQDFADQLRGQPMEEIPRHLLATLHLACEGKLEISSEPFVMDKISIKKI